MDTQLVNDAFNETLEEIGGGDHTFSVAFAQHHEAELETRILRLRNQNTFQNMGFLLLLAGLVFAFRRGLINLPVAGLGSNTLLGLVILWILIAANSLLIGQRNRKILAIEKQLLLISVYRKIQEKTGG